MPQVSKLAISPDGAITMVYSDDHLELMDQGATEIHRASDVEPADPGLGTGWFARMRDYDAMLGPFRSRAEALAAEVAYLESKLF